MTATGLANLRAVPIDKGSSDLVDVQGAESRWLIASPYLDQDHLLDLETLGTQDRMFAIALSSLQPATEDYAVVKYEDVFDFSALTAQLRFLVGQRGVRWKRQDFYVVEFRSQVKVEYDNDRLSFLDKESHKEAVASGGLLKYWFGIPNGDRKNLATCFWHNKQDAVSGGRGPLHREARGFIGKAYDSITIKGLRFTIEDDVAQWMIEPYN